MNYKLIVWSSIGVVVLALILILNPFVIIPAGERGVVLNLGAVSDTIMGEGIHWRTPLIQSVKKIDVKIQKEQVAVASASKDLQTVSSQIALNYHLQADKVNVLWQTIGKDYKERIIDPAVQEAMKASTAKYTAEELITKRSLVKDDIKVILAERLVREYIIVDEVSITDFDFSQSFNSAIEAKVTAEQNALGAKNKLEQTKYEAEQRIAQAKGEAEAIKIQAQAINSQGGADYVQLQAIKQWNGTVPTYMMGNAVPFINLNK
jgi:regulator of protease activity HflC (stomatin/prohibitin superfamily)